MLFDEENGYTPEYIYGNYFERLSVKEIVDFKNKEKVGNFDEKEGKVEEFGVDGDDEKEGGKKNGKVANLGLKDLIESGEGELSGGRILHRNVNAGSPRF
ncbi:hypothetical protein Leryth_010935 [Lithospermum erythrorhizon]|nr:hypothetical protein Leryth_010935 [Lithospermum erythrorhizon]